MASTTIPVISKLDLEKRIGQGYRVLRSALEALPRERFKEKLRTGWSLNENLAHFAAWEETVPPRVAGVLERGEDPKLYDDVDGFNARVAGEAKDESTDDLFARWAVAHERLLETVRVLPENAAKLAFDVVEWNTTGHYPDHYADVGAAIRPSDDLFGLVQTNWIGFRGLIVAIGLAGLEEKTSTGWMYKDVVAHAAAWEDRTASRLRTFHESGEAKRYLGVDDTDEFNAAVVERTRGRTASHVLRDVDDAHERLVAYWMEQVPAEMPNRLAGRRGPAPDIDAENAREAKAGAERSAEEVLHRLDTAYRMVVGTVKALPQDRDVPFLAVRLVVGETYGHFVEHGAEVEAALPKTAAAMLERFDDVWRRF